MSEVLRFSRAEFSATPSTYITALAPRFQDKSTSAENEPRMLFKATTKGSALSPDCRDRRATVAKVVDFIALQSAVTGRVLRPPAPRIARLAGAWRGGPRGGPHSRREDQRGVDEWKL